MVVRAAIPLLVEIGPSVTTLQIARAAGISEPTIFRAFADKSEVLAACLAEVTDPPKGPGRPVICASVLRATSSRTVSPGGGDHSARGRAGRRSRRVTGLCWPFLIDEP